MDKKFTRSSESPSLKPKIIQNECKDALTTILSISDTDKELNSSENSLISRAVENRTPLLVERVKTSTSTRRAQTSKERLKSAVTIKSTTTSNEREPSAKPALKPLNLKPKTPLKTSTTPYK